MRSNHHQASTLPLSLLKLKMESFTHFQQNSLTHLLSPAAFLFFFFFFFFFFLLLLFLKFASEVLLRTKTIALRDL
jgi:hypothetical protein